MSLLLDGQVATTLPDDGGDSWWSSANLAAIPIAIAAASLAASVAAAGTINRHNDEIVPQAVSVSGQAGSAYGARLRHTTLFLQQPATDELPAQAATPVFEDDTWKAYWRTPEVVSYGFGSNEDFVPAPATFAPDEDYWFGLRARLVDALVVVPASTDEIGTPATTLGVDETESQPIPPKEKDPTGIFWATGDSGIPAVAVAEEDYWWRPWWLPTKIQSIVSVDDDIVPQPVGGGGSVAGLETCYGQRLQHSTVFLRWPANDEFPPQSATIVEESDWQQQVVAKPRVQQLPRVDDDLPVTPVAIIVEDDPWLAPQVARDAIRVQPPSSDEEIVPQPAPLNVEDEYDIRAMLYSVKVPPVVVLFGGDEEMGDFVAPPAPPVDQPVFEYHGHRNRHDVDYETVVKQWELLELRRRQASERKRIHAQERSPAQAPSAGAPEVVLSPLLKIDLDAILSRHKFQDAASTVERYNALRAAIAEVEEMELLVLMAVAAADDD